MYYIAKQIVCTYICIYMYIYKKTRRPQIVCIMQATISMENAIFS